MSEELKVGSINFGNSVPNGMTEHDLRIIVRQVLAEDNEDPWQPIETAPRDGTEILVCMEGDKDSVCIVEYFSFNWVYPTYEDTGIYREPTHWMPIPKPHKGEKQ